jgi:hypothetical protein
MPEADEMSIGDWRHSRMREVDPLMAMLGDGVPVTLLLDLLRPPDADEVYVVEGGSADWLRRAPAPRSA